MYLETCKDEHAHYRCFDVTEKTNVKRHKTGRSCQQCREPLADTIVHFGEMNRTDMPYRWLEGFFIPFICVLIYQLQSRATSAWLWFDHYNWDESESAQSVQVSVAKGRHHCSRQFAVDAKNEAGIVGDQSEKVRILKVNKK